MSNSINTAMFRLGGRLAREVVLIVSEVSQGQISIKEAFISATSQGGVHLHIQLAFNYIIFDWIYIRKIIGKYIICE